MNRDDIIRMAREAGLIHAWMPTIAWPHPEAITRFFNLAYAAGASAEREECAKLCETIATETYGMTNLWEYGECAAAIRERGQQ